MQFRTFSRRALAAGSLALVLVACGDDGDAVTTTQPAATEAPTTMPAETMPDESMPMKPSSELCTADEIVAAVQGGPAAGTLEGMTTDPVGTAASNNPVLTTLTAAVTAAGLVDTLNSAEALTVFAPTDCAFANLDKATLDAALADPTGLLTTVLAYHVVPERLSAADLDGITELPTLGGEMLPIEKMGDTIKVGDQAMVVVGEIQTLNATVYLIDTVMLPPMEG
ncbi:MAG: fasciclin domain-containing protein [Ilumatobacteraceae bacterium]